MCPPGPSFKGDIFQIFISEDKNIHIPEEHCYTDFLSSQILFRNKKRLYEMILEDHLHHVRLRTGINFNFLPRLFSSSGHQSHILCQRILNSGQLSLLSSRPGSSLHLTKTMQNNKMFSNHSLFAIRYFIGPSSLINLQDISPNFHITLKLLVPVDISISNCVTNTNSKLSSLSFQYFLHCTHLI